ncbi:MULTISPECIES: DUF3501 family protein [Candidatus Neomicrothrix]|jgi:hypothetical protein|uniref:Putative Fructose-6-phosphate aldolase 2 n=1 Tax=Candidatus Neomicrothrix parvicella RN1 TaxID=1229780 RepID=R4Z1D0_9ACTN|nr:MULTISPECIES: DUF3501 family protein [Microthrix]NLH68454.1 DUF3501 family protein [Candidatus Microthrix parvicella]MBK6501450.1 DUF3501 family protein [Candidatus Microthrix sp.]MBK7020058.1 DUF3501 family protein [Candidatus Microthrix sp.]MBK7322681.1 DUF3501 family protein [Candidatus Microthrix sp.]MBL0202900.1 DUF3501 family protein [Candidatus Microthrix sp.]
MTRSLTLDDIVDNAAYEDERDEFRTRIIALKKRRRIGVGEFVTLVFENRETMRFQIQEMARVERMDSDAAIEGELAVYNKLIPEPGSLSATLFIELTSDEDLRSWLPKLVGIEKSIELRLSDGTVIVDIPEADHEAQLTREEITASVHYIGFVLTESEVEAFAAGPVELAVNHSEYQASVTLGGETTAELLADLRADG